MDNLIIPSWMKLLTTLRNNGDNGGAKSLYRVSVDINITYSHVSNLKNLLTKKGLITSKKSGRVLKISLTEKGRSIAGCIDKFMEVAR